MPLIVLFVLPIGSTCFGHYYAHHHLRRKCRVNTVPKYHRTPLIRKLVFRISNYSDRLGTSCKSVYNSTKIICLEITAYRIKYSTVLWFLELQDRCGRKVQTQVLNPSAWGHLNPSSYCDVGRLFYGVFKLWSKLQRKK